MTAIPHGHHDIHHHDDRRSKDKAQPGFIGAVKEVAGEFAEDDVMTQGAAVAFYSGLAVAPLLTLGVWIMQAFFGADAKEKIVAGFESVAGAAAAAPIRELLNPASEAAQKGMTVAGIVSIGILLFSASSVFGQLQSALNSIWDVKAKPGNSIMGFINKRLLSLGMLMSIFFLLIVSLVISAALAAVSEKTGGSEESVVWVVINHAISLAVFTALFAGLFKFVPDARIAWRVVWVGGFIAALLFTLGKFGLSWYLGRGSYQSSYGAAVGSFVALLVWVYYSAIIVLIGAEVTEVYARRTGQAVEPSEHAVRVVTEEKVDTEQSVKLPDSPKPRT